MIVVDVGDAFRMIAQYDHSLHAGEMGAWLRDEAFSSPDRRTSVLTGVAEHDLAWQGMDKVPMWNDAGRKPYSFLDLPDSWKLAHYHCGVDELEARDPYAGLLASRHYTAFFEHATDSDALAFLARERSRQARIAADLGVEEQDVERDVRIVQFLDKLSLYVCLSDPPSGQNPGAPWLQRPFPELEPALGEPVEVHWVGSGRVGLKPFPFRAAFACDVPVRRVDKRRIAAVGIATAYQEAPVERERVTMSPA